MSAPFPEQDFLAGTWRTLDEIAEKSHGECSFDLHEVLRVADKYDADTETVSWSHDWHQEFPVMNLMCRCFDTFAIWCLAYHSGERFDQLGGKLNGRIEMTGVAPQSLKEPQGNKQDDFRHRFAKVYAPYYSSRFSLSRLEQERVYRRLVSVA